MRVWVANAVRRETSAVELQLHSWFLIETSKNLQIHLLCFVTSYNFDNNIYHVKVFNRCYCRKLIVFLFNITV